MGGVPCIAPAYPRGHGGRMIADGMINDEILRTYPDLEAQDIREALQFCCGNRCANASYTVWLPREVSCR